MTDERRKKVIKYVINGFAIVILAIVWLLIVKYGFEYSKLYIDDALADIEMKSNENYLKLEQQNNMLNKDIDSLNDDIGMLRDEVATLNEEILLFTLEVRSLKSSIDIIDTSVSNSVQIQAEIGVRIQELDVRLEELRKSLNILLEAPNE